MWDLVVSGFSLVLGGLVAGAAFAIGILVTGYLVILISFLLDRDKS